MSHVPFKDQTDIDFGAKAERIINLKWYYLFGRESNFSMVTFQELKNVDLRIARVVQAEEIIGSKSLLKLKVDAGDEDHLHTIITAIKPNYTAKDLLGTFILVALNLKLENLESDGILLAIEVGDGGVLLRPDPKFLDKIKPGMKLA